MALLTVTGRVTWAQLFRLSSPATIGGSRLGRNERSPRRFNCTGITPLDSAYIGLFCGYKVTVFNVPLHPVDDKRDDELSCLAHEPQDPAYEGFKKLLNDWKF